GHPQPITADLPDDAIVGALAAASRQAPTEPERARRPQRAASGRACGTRPGQVANERRERSALIDIPWLPRRPTTACSLLRSRLGAGLLLPNVMCLDDRLVPAGCRPAVNGPSWAASSPAPLWPI